MIKNILFQNLYRKNRPRLLFITQKLLFKGLQPHTYLRKKKILSHLPLSTRGLLLAAAAAPKAESEIGAM